MGDASGHIDALEVYNVCFLQFKTILFSNFPFALGFLLATFFLCFGDPFWVQKVALLNPLSHSQTNGKISTLVNLCGVGFESRVRLTFSDSGCT